MTLFRLTTKKIPPTSEKPRRSAGLPNWQSGWKDGDRLPGYYNAGLICACRAGRPARLLPVGQQHAVARQYAVLRRQHVVARQYAVALQNAVVLQHEVGLQYVVQRQNAAVV